MPRPAPPLTPAPHDAAPARRTIPLCLGTALALLLAALLGSVLTPRHRQAAPPPRPRLIFALDASCSMLCTDGATTRLVQAQTIVRTLLEHTPACEHALVSFGSEALADFPPSLDSDSLLAALDDIAPAPTFLPGSSPAAALSLADSLAADSPAVIVLLTDGEIQSAAPQEPAWLNRHLPLAWCILGLGAPAPVPLGSSWLRDPDTAAVALSQATPDAISRLAGLSPAPHARILPDDSPARLTATVDSLLQTAPHTTTDITAPYPPSWCRLCALLASLLLLAAIALRHRSRRPLPRTLILLSLLLATASHNARADSTASSTTSTLPTPDTALLDTLRQPDLPAATRSRLLLQACQRQWQLAHTAASTTDALPHARLGLELCQEALRLATPASPAAHCAATNLQLFLRLNQQLQAPQDAPPPANASPATTENSQPTAPPTPPQTPPSDTESRQNEAALAFAGDPAPAPPPAPAPDTPPPAQLPTATHPRPADQPATWRSLLQQQHAIAPRPHGVKPW